MAQNAQGSDSCHYRDEIPEPSMHRTIRRFGYQQGRFESSVESFTIVTSNPLKQTSNLKKSAVPPKAFTSYHCSYGVRALSAVTRAGVPPNK
jgi:hypothetical protein